MAQDPNGSGGAGKESGEIVKPPNRLARVVPKEGGKLLSEIERDVKEAVKELEGSYRDQLAKDMEELVELHAELKADCNDEVAGKLFRVVHNMRGQAGTFGFPLITEVGQSLCVYLKKVENASALKLDLVDAHINALKVIQREQITGGGDTLSQQVVAALREIIAAEMARLG